MSEREKLFHEAVEELRKSDVKTLILAKGLAMGANAVKQQVVKSA